MQMVVDGTLINYSDQGAGPVLLCVHGWMQDHQTFDKLRDELTGYRMVAIDLPNFGASQQTDAIVTIANYGKLLGAFVKKLGLKKFTAVGHSMGGQILIQATADGQLAPQRLVLLASAGVRDGRKMRKFLLRLMAKTAGILVPLRFKKQAYRWLKSDYQPDLSVIHKQVIDNVLKTDVVAAAGRVTIPSLLIYGSSDTSTPLSVARRLDAALSNSQLVIVADEQHWAHNSAAPVVARHILEFLQ